MFFMRLRRSTKPVFIFLAVVFALSFVFLGVGSGSSGIGDLLRGNFKLFGSGSSSGTSVKGAQERIRKNPEDAAGYRDLATALETKGRTAEAIAALESYRKLRPKDLDAQRELAGLYLREADDAARQAQAAQLGVDAAPPLASFAPPPSQKLAQGLGVDPIDQAVTQKVTTAATEARQRQQDAATKAVAVYQRIASLSPKDPTVRLELAQASETAGDARGAIVAYEAFVKLAPDDPTTPQIRQRIKQLRPFANGAVTPQVPTG